MSERFVVSLCGTFLKPEMLSVYRQVTGLKRWRTEIFTEQRINAERFPFDPVTVLKKRGFRPRGNFLRRFYWKHLRGTWPPPGYVEPIPPRDFEFCDLVPLLRDRKPDLLHIYYGHKARKYLPLVEKWGGPLLVSFHGVDVAENEDKAAYAATFPELFSVARVVAARSHSLLTRLGEMGCPAEKLRLNRTPIPLDHISAKVREVPADGRWVFVQACRLIAKKGIFTTLEALRKVVARWPEVRYVIAGDGPMRSRIEEAAANAGLSSNIELVGWVDQARLMELFEGAHLFLHPSETTSSLDQEGIPNSMLEAMAAGLPVVATLHGGIPEAMDSGSEGLLVPERSPDELAAALLRVMETPGLLAEFSRKARATVTERFGMDASIAALENAYDEAVEQ